MCRCVMAFIMVYLALVQYNISMGNNKQKAVAHGAVSNDVGYGEILPMDQRNLDKILGTLPPQDIIAAHLIIDGKWFILDSTEILAVRRLLSEAKPFFIPKELDHVSLKARRDAIILWGVVKGKMVAFDVVYIATPIYHFDSTAKNRIYTVEKLEKEKELLQKTITSARNGNKNSISATEN